MFGQRDNSCRHASHAAAIVILSTVLRTMSSYHARLLVPINTSFLLYAYIDSQQIFRTACWKTQHKRERVASFLDRTVKQVPHKIGFIGNKKGIFYCSSFFNLKQDWWHDYRDGPHACCTCNAQSSVLPSGIYQSRSSTGTRYIFRNIKRYYVAASNIIGLWVREQSILWYSPQPQRFWDSSKPRCSFQQ